MGSLGSRKRKDGDGVCAARLPVGNSVSTIWGMARLISNLKSHSDSNSDSNSKVDREEGFVATADHRSCSGTGECVPR